MSIEVFNRYEKKYILDNNQFEILQKGITDYMNTDKYNKNGEFYNIANIYYDTDENLLIRSSLEKPIYKEKLRLRSYGVPNRDDVVFLEIKKKYDGMVNKRRTNIVLKEAYEFIENGTISCKPFMNKQVVKEIEYMLKKHKLVPKLYLSYDRKAFFCKEDVDFRLTFDTNIITRRYDLKLEDGHYGDNLLGEGKWIMEMKATKGIPLWFTKLLSENYLYPVTISKYGTEYKKNIINKNNSESISAYVKKTDSLKVS